MAAYLVCLRSAARSAAAPGVMDVRALWEAANVSGQVTSHVRHLPTFQGTSVIPSGRLPSDLKRPIGSLDEGTPDRTQARHNMSFNVLCLIVRPALLLQHTVSSDVSKFDGSMIGSVQDEIQSIRLQANKSMSMSNDNEQYSRRNNLRIRGLVPDNGADMVSTVLSFLKDKLDINDLTPFDIVAAHPLPPLKSKDGRNNPPIPVMLLKLRNRQIRDGIIMKRKKLKGTVYSIDKDLTALNIQLMTRLRNSDRVSQTWSWNGKIYAALPNNKTIIAKPFATLDEMFTYSDVSRE